MKMNYLFHSERLGFRNWNEHDLEAFAELNADPEVMAHFPKPLSTEETAGFITRLQDHFDKHGYTYYATEIIETGEFIGFVGLAYQEYETDFTPATDIGWRLKKSAWGKGYATEGAKRCLQHAFETLQLSLVVAVCTLRNINSENVMQKIGMTKKGEFDHPKLADYQEHRRCVWYEITRK